MLPEQLDLFGGPPRPPKRIREEEPAPQPTLEQQLDVPAPADEADEVDSPAAVNDDLPDWVTDGHNDDPVSTSFPESAPAANEIVEAGMEITETNPLEENAAALEESPEEAPVVSPISEVIAWLEPEEPLDDAEAAAVDAAAGENGSSIVVEYPEPKLQVEPIADETILIVSVKNKEKADKGVLDDLSPDGLNVPPDEILFKRQYYTMRKTAGMFGISHSMLRYWENEFDILQPRKNKKGDRYFRPIDIKNLQLIYHLLKLRKFTIDGAKEYLRQHNKALDTFELIQKLEKVKLFLQELKMHL